MYSTTQESFTVVKLLSLIIKGQDYFTGLILDTLFIQIQSNYPSCMVAKHVGELHMKCAGVFELILKIGGYVQ